MPQTEEALKIALAEKQNHPERFALPRPMLGRRVVVYGGGNTAIDVARTAKRLGASEAIIVYRRTREKAPAHDSEIEEALQEGVMVKWLSTIKQAGEGNITVEKMALDDKGFPQPTGEFETLEADSVVLALGQDVDQMAADESSATGHQYVCHGSLRLKRSRWTGPRDRPASSGNAGTERGTGTCGGNSRISCSLRAAC